MNNSYALCYNFNLTRISLDETDTRNFIELIIIYNSSHTVKI